MTATAEVVPASGRGEPVPPPEAEFYIGENDGHPEVFVRLKMVFVGPRSIENQDRIATKADRELHPKVWAKFSKGKAYKAFKASLLASFEKSL